jgi:hypothetical protein
MAEIIYDTQNVYHISVRSVNNKLPTITNESILSMNFCVNFLVLFLLSSDIRYIICIATSLEQ